jgi:hypothetical protein
MYPAGRIVPLPNPTERKTRCEAYLIPTTPFQPPVLPATVKLPENSIGILLPVPTDAQGGPQSERAEVEAYEGF